MEVGTPERIEKGWGHELIFANEPKYCGKIMKFNAGEMTSMHFHIEKMETFFVLAGEFIIHTIETKDATRKETVLEQGQTMKIPQFLPHQIEARTDGELIEVSTHDDTKDSLRVEEGSSQKKRKLTDGSSVSQYMHDEEHITRNSFNDSDSDTTENHPHKTSQKQNILTGEYFFNEHSEDKANIFPQFLPFQWHYP